MVKCLFCFFWKALQKASTFDQFHYFLHNSSEHPRSSSGAVNSIVSPLVHLPFASFSNSIVFFKKSISLIKKNPLFSNLIQESTPSQQEDNILQRKGPRDRTHHIEWHPKRRELFLVQQRLKALNLPLDQLNQGPQVSPTITRKSYFFEGRALSFTLCKLGFPDLFCFLPFQ